jgi:peptidoglycan hydrolase-like protein with peptidoglycan-binding domain
MEKLNIVSSRQRWVRWTVLLTVVVFLIPSARLIAKQKKQAHAARRTTVRHRRRHSRRYRRYLHVRIQPARVKEIQEALVKAGLLHDKPDGVWGPATRDAMKRFQKQNGFTPTGLPEAKPLMLLGLGPHPLPPGLGPLPPAETDAATGSAGDPETSSASTSPAVKRPTSSN